LTWVQNLEASCSPAAKKDFYMSSHAPAGCVCVCLFVWVLLLLLCYRVACVRQGGLRFTINGNPWFLLVLITNVGGAGDVQQVSVMSSELDWWMPMQQNWGQNWQFVGPILYGQSLSFMTTTSDGQTVVSHNVADSYWEFGQTFEGSQFRW